MIEELKFFNIFVVWTRSIVLILSILVVVLSLSVYNYNSIPVISLLDQDADTSMALKGHKIIYDMIQDRRLIATLVAAQASIFCPLFLLMSSSNMMMRIDPFYDISSVEIWRAGIEQFCQFLMPLGLAFSWIFCITFDKRMETAMLDEYSIEILYLTSNNWCSLCTYVADGLKYFIIIALIMEVLAIWVASFKYVSILYISQSQYSIRLDEDDHLEYRVGSKSEKALCN